MSLKKIETDENFALAVQDSQELREIMQDNFGDEAAISFDRAKFPTAGGKQFSLPGIEGDEYTTSIEGVIVAHHTTRAYWAKPFSGSTPPDCYSVDGRVGIGEPGGECARCPLNQWGSDNKGGRGKACKEMRRVYLLRHDEAIPILVTLPPTSLAAYQQYANRLVRGHLSVKQVITRIGLEQQKNQDGIEFSKATMAAQGRLSPEQVQAVRDVSKVLEQFIYSVPVESDDYVVEGSGAVDTQSFENAPYEYNPQTGQVIDRQTGEVIQPDSPPAPDTQVIDDLASELDQKPPLPEKVGTKAQLLALMESYGVTRDRLEINSLGISLEDFIKAHSVQQAYQRFRQEAGV